MSNFVKVPDSKFLVAENIESFDVVIPLTQFRYMVTRGKDELVAEAKRIISEIKRHVDLDRYEHENMTYKIETSKTCGHCGAGWGPDDKGCNWCCDNHMEEWEAEFLTSNPEWEINDQGEAVLKERGEA